MKARPADNQCTRPGDGLPPQSETDKCVLCGADTGVKSSAPVDKRMYYVQGGGQLCRRCYFGTVGGSESENGSDEYIAELLYMIKKNGREK